MEGGSIGGENCVDGAMDTTSNAKSSVEESVSSDEENVDDDDHVGEFCTVYNRYEKVYNL